MRTIVNYWPLTILFAVIFSGTSARAQSTETISNVTGLQNALNIRPTSGTAFAISRTAVINSTGSLDGAVGSLGDCLHVDGTSGACGDSSDFIDDETPSGTTNGTNPVFTLSGTPVIQTSTSPPQASLLLFRNGLRLRNGLDYDLSVNTITFRSCCVPSSGDILTASYRAVTSGSGSKNITTTRNTRGVEFAPAAFMDQITTEQAALEITIPSATPTSKRLSDTGIPATSVPLRTGYRSLRALQERQRTRADGAIRARESQTSEQERRLSQRTLAQEKRGRAVGPDVDDDYLAGTQRLSPFRSLRKLQERTPQ